MGFPHHRHFCSSSSPSPSSSSSSSSTSYSSSSSSSPSPASFSSSTTSTSSSSSSYSSSSSPASLTVWRKSLIFHGNGYTVFDNSSGKMVFRVDNYNHNWREETFLMDVQGNVLITIRRCRKRLGILESWEAYKGERNINASDQREKPLFKATKTLGNPSCKISMAEGNADKPLDYRMDWSSQNGWSKIYRTSSGYLPVAEVHRKNGTRPHELYGKDVLTLCVQPGVDQALVMAMVMVTDAMR